MPGLEQTSLSPRQQRLAEKARVALAHGQFDYVREVTGEILRAAPSCVSVRRLQRSAQLGLAGSRVGWVRQARAGLGLARLRLGGAAAASARLSAAERLLAVDPRNAGALHVLADAARELKRPPGIGRGSRVSPASRLLQAAGGGGAGGRSFENIVQLSGKYDADVAGERNLFAGVFVGPPFAGNFDVVADEAD